MIVNINPAAITLDTPDAGWSGLHLDREAFIALSYIQNIPDELIDHAQTWMEGKDATWEIDGEGSTWQVIIPAGDNAIKLVTPYGDPVGTDLSSKVFLLQFIDKMLETPRGWGEWRLEYDDTLNDTVNDTESVWEQKVGIATEALVRDLTETRAKLAAA